MTVTYRPGDPTLALEGLDVEHRPADLLDERALDRALEGAEVVYHTAALVTFDSRLYDLQMRVNVEGTRRLLEAAMRAGVRRFVHTSTVNTLGIPPDDRPGDEDTPFDWGPYRLGYMDSKRASENLVLQAARRDLDAVCVLPGTMLGPADVNFNAGSYVRLVARGLGLAAPPGGTTLAHVDDVARGHLLAAERGGRGERYVLGGDPISYEELFALIARIVGRAGPRFVLPARLMTAAGRLGSWLWERAGIPTAGLHHGVMVAACSRLYYSSEKARRELGWSWRPPEPAVRDAVDWYRHHGLIW